MAAVDIRHYGLIAVVTIDNPPVNALGRAQRLMLLDTVETLDADDTVRAVILMGGGRTFTAGADLNEFAHSLETPYLPNVIERIEQAEKPWTAAIHGAALGGGLEIALGCRFRLATADSLVGLPEVTLGLVPGAGGTVRTLYLIGFEAAIELVTSGEPINAAHALQLGLLDAVVATDTLLDAAIDFCNERLQSALPLPVSNRLLQLPSEELWQHIEADIKRRSRGQIAPLKALSCLRKTAELEFGAAMAFERQTFLECRNSAEATALRYVFFARKKARHLSQLQNIEVAVPEKAGIIGGGTMGAGIAMALLAAGLAVTLIGMR